MINVIFAELSSMDIKLVLQVCEFIISEIDFFYLSLSLSLCLSNTVPKRGRFQFVILIYQVYKML